MSAGKPTLPQLENPVHVLLVDDSLTNLRITGKVLGRLGCGVTTASSGEEALERIAEGKFHLVLLDYQMPGMDGPETAREIHARLGTGAPPIIALTGSVDLQVFKACKAAGMRLVLKKPVPAEHLRAIVERLQVPMK